MWCEGDYYSFNYLIMINKYNSAWKCFTHLFPNYEEENTLEQQQEIVKVVKAYEEEESCTKEELEGT